MGRESTPPHLTVNPRGVRAPDARKQLRKLQSAEKRGRWDRDLNLAAQDGSQRPSLLEGHAVPLHSAGYTTHIGVPKGHGRPGGGHANLHAARDLTGAIGTSAMCSGGASVK